MTPFSIDVEGAVGDGQIPFCRTLNSFAEKFVPAVAVLVMYSYVRVMGAGPLVAEAAIRPRVIREQLELRDEGRLHARNFPGLWAFART